jgi:hypothetical protein
MWQEKKAVFKRYGKTARFTNASMMRSILP